MTDSKLTSIEIGRAALKIAVTGSRTEEQRVKQELAEHGIRSTAVDFGGEFIPSIVKIVERAVVAAEAGARFGYACGCRCGRRGCPCGFRAGQNQGVGLQCGRQDRYCPLRRASVRGHLYGGRRAQSQRAVCRISAPFAG